MAEPSPFPLVDIAVAMLARGPQILAVYNSHWGAFTLPMTKRRHWQDPNIPPTARDEAWTDAAVRAAAEWLGTTLTTSPALLFDIAEYRQGDRDGVVKRFHFQVFRLILPPEQQPFPGVMTEWLAPAQWLDPQRRPISPTARFLMEQLQSQGLL